MSSNEKTAVTPGSGRFALTERWINIFSGVLVPLILGGFGFVFTWQQSELEMARQEQLRVRDEVRQGQLRERDDLLRRQQQEIEDIRQLIELFTHEQAVKQQMGLHLFKYLAKEDRLPVEIEDVLTEYAESLTTGESEADAAAPATEGGEETDPPVASDTRETPIPPVQYATAQLQQQAFAQEVLKIAKDVESTIPPRIYIHIADARQRADAQAIRDRLETLDLRGEKIVYPDIRTEPGPRTSQLRFFKESEKAEASAIHALIVPLVPDLELVDLSETYGDSKKIRPRHYELWFAPGRIGTDN